jgi:hypothetical protein
MTSSLPLTSHDCDDIITASPQDPYVVLSLVAAPPPPPPAPGGGPPVDGTVRVRLLRARGLLPADSNGKSDPYVTLSLRDGLHAPNKPQRSNTHKETLEPDFGLQEFSFAAVVDPVCTASLDLITVAIAKGRAYRPRAGRGRGAALGAGARGEGRVTVTPSPPLASYVMASSPPLLR